MRPDELFLIRPPHGHLQEQRYLDIAAVADYSLECISQSHRKTYLASPGPCPGAGPTEWVPGASVARLYEATLPDTGCLAVQRAHQIKACRSNAA